MNRLVSFGLFLFLVAVVLRADFLFVVFYFAIFLYVSARWWAGALEKGISLRSSVTHRAFQGDPITVEIGVRNRSRLLTVPWLELQESVPLTLAQPSSPRRWVVSLRPGEEKTIAYQLFCRRRGHYWLGPTRVELGDVLGIEPRSRRISEPSRLIVYPRVVPLDRLGLPTHSPLAALRVPTPLLEDSARLMGVRDYRPTDPLRRIHWSATARRGQLVVKQYQTALSRDTLICLDFDRSSYERGRRERASELAIVTAASLASHVILRERLAAGLFSQAIDPLVGETVRIFLRPGSQRGHLMGVLEMLARVALTPSQSFPEALRRRVSDLSWGATLAVITGRASQALVEALAQVKRDGFPVALFVVGAEPEAGHDTRILGIPVFPIRDEAHLLATA